MATFTSSDIGVDLTQAQSSTQPTFGLGNITRASDNSIWQYVQAAETVRAYSLVGINASGQMKMARLTSLNGVEVSPQLAVAQFAFQPSEYGWVPVHGDGGPNGTFKVRVSGSVSAGLMLYVGTVTGNISITAATSGTLEGIAVTTAMDTANTAVTAAPCIITWPRARTLGA
jgi:hypothetical protein